MNRDNTTPMTLHWKRTIRMGATLYISPRLPKQLCDCLSSTCLKSKLQGWWAWHGDQDSGSFRTAPVPTQHEGITPPVRWVTKAKLLKQTHLLTFGHTIFYSETLFYSRFENVLWHGSSSLLYLGVSSLWAFQTYTMNTVVHLFLTDCDRRWSNWVWGLSEILQYNYFYVGK